MRAKHFVAQLVMVMTFTNKIFPINLIQLRICLFVMLVCVVWYVQHVVVQATHTHTRKHSRTIAYGIDTHDHTPSGRFLYRCTTAICKAWWYMHKTIDCLVSISFSWILTNWLQTCNLHFENDYNSKRTTFAFRLDNQNKRVKLYEWKYKF